MSKAILITGAAGFLGSNLAADLVARGYRVIGYDNLSMGRLANLAPLMGTPQFEFRRGDVTDPRTFHGVDLDLDCIVHLAAFKIPRYGKAIETLRINYRGTENALDLAVRADCKCVLASTSDVYGRNPVLPFSEAGDSVIGSSKVARWSYAVSKLFDEHLGFAYQESYGIPVTSLRFFGSYGPNQHLSWWGGPPPVFIDAALARDEIPVHGVGLQTRSFTYVSDTVAGIHAAMVRPEANGEVINIGSTREVTIAELARKVWELVNPGSEPRIKFIGYESFTGKAYDDVRRRVPDASLCKRLLDVEARVSLEEGLARTIAWQRLTRQSELV